MELPLTGLPDTDRKILFELHDKDLFHACSSSSYLSKLCNDDFWRMKFIDTFGANLKNYKEINYKLLYHKLRKMDQEEAVMDRVVPLSNNLRIVIICN